MPKKKRAHTKRGSFKPVSAKTREEDERLRETLRKADLGLFGKVMAKAMKARPA